MVDRIIESQIAVMNAARPLSKKREQAAGLIYTRLSSHHRAALKELINDGPLESARLISTVACDDLIKWGMAVRICFKGSKGYMAATETGWEIQKSFYKELIPTFIPGL